MPPSSGDPATGRPNDPGAADASPNPDDPYGSSSEESAGSATGSGAPRGIVEQLRLTYEAARRLLRSHVELAKAELAAIGGEIASVAFKAGIALAFLLFIGTLLPIGLTLFLGDVLFGSIGWGILHGTELALGVALAAILSALGVGTGGVLRRLVVGILLGIGVAYLLGSGLALEGWTRLRDDAVAPYLVSFDPAWHTLLVAVGASALVVGVLFALVGLAKGGFGGLLSGLVGGAILGSLIGALSTVELAWHVAAAIGVTVALGLWPLLALGQLRKVDPERLKARFYPTATIETARETYEWLERIRR